MKNLKSDGIKKNILLLVGMFLIVIALPIATKLVQQSQENRSNAASKRSVHCTSFSYGSWGPCNERGVQYRVLKSKKPKGCTDPGIIFRSCTTSTPVKVNGVCGSAKNSCSKGNFSDIVDIEYYYKWKCLGINGGKTVNCALAKPVVNYNNVIPTLNLSVEAD